MTRVLHVLDHSLPLHSGYTFRTRAILKAQEAHGLAVRGITGLRHQASLREAGELEPVETVDGLTFHRTQGEAGGLPGFAETLNAGEIDSILAWVQSRWPEEIYVAWLERTVQRKGGLQPVGKN